MEVRTGKMITVLLFKDKYEDSKNVNIGDVLDLKKEPHRNDESAIKVNLNGSQVGYIANAKDKTTLEGTASASEIQNDFTAKAKAEVISFEEERGFMQLLKAELILIEKEETTEKETPDEIIFNLTGGISTYPGKQDLVKDVSESPRIIKLVADNDRVLGEYNGKMAGIIRKNDKNFELIQDYVQNSPEITATAISSINKRAVKCRLIIPKAITVQKGEIGDEVERIVKEGINTKEELDEKIAYLEKCKVSDVAILNLFQSYIKYPKDVASRIVKTPKTLYIDTSGIVESSICYMNIGKNLLFEGDKGVGKNVLTETLSWLYNRPLYEFSSNSQHSNNSLLGSQTFENSIKTEDSDEDRKSALSVLSFMRVARNLFFKGADKVKSRDLSSIQSLFSNLLGRLDKRIIFEKSSIVEAFEVGGIIVLDEFNTSLAHVMPIFNALLDDRRRMEITGLGAINGHKNFCAIATQNRDYEGTFEGNEATVDRFEPIMFPSSTSIVEILSQKVPNISYDITALIDKLYTDIKNSVETGDIDSQALSIRGFISACEVLNQGKPLKEALIVSVANRVRDLDSREAIRNLIDLHVV